MVANNFYINSSNVDKKRVTGPSSRMLLDGDEIRFQNSASAAADTTVSWSERLKIKGMDLKQDLTYSTKRLLLKDHKETFLIFFQERTFSQSKYNIYKKNLIKSEELI